MGFSDGWSQRWSLNCQQGCQLSVQKILRLSLRGPSATGCSLVADSGRRIAAQMTHGDKCGDRAALLAARSAAMVNPPSLHTLAYAAGMYTILHVQNTTEIHHLVGSYLGVPTLRAGRVMIGGGRSWERSSTAELNEVHMWEQAWNDVFGDIHDRYPLNVHRSILRFQKDMLGFSHLC